MQAIGQTVPVMNPRAGNGFYVRFKDTVTCGTGTPASICATNSANRISVRGRFSVFSCRQRSARLQQVFEGLTEYKMGGTHSSALNRKDPLCIRIPSGGHVIRVNSRQGNATKSSCVRRIKDTLQPGFLADVRGTRITGNLLHFACILTIYQKAKRSFIYFSRICSAECQVKGVHTYE